MRNQVSLARRQASRLRVLQFGAVALFALFAFALGSVAVQGALSHDAAPGLAMVPLLVVGGLMFRSPEGGGGGGNSEVPETCPAITGETPEAKLQSAGDIVTKLWGRLTKALGDLATKTKDYLELEKTSNQLKTDLQTEKDGHTATKGLLDTEKTNHTATSGKLTKSEERVKHLESLCDLKGIDKDQVIPPAPSAKSGDDERAELVKQLNEAKTPQERGERANTLREFDARAKKAAAKAKE